MERTNKRFLTAEWRNLVVLNYGVDPEVLAPYLPRGTAVDLWDGQALVSLVGFEFRDTRVWGVPVPLHRTFPEVNLRCYVRRQLPSGWRRGVTFIRELVPRRAVTWVARALYGENYQTVPMRYRAEAPDNDGRGRFEAEYAWKWRGDDYRLGLVAGGVGREAETGSLEEFIIEHYWGYSGGVAGSTIEYAVEHRRWRLWGAEQAEFSGDAERLYGPRFGEALSGKPHSAFYVDGSAVTVYRGRRIAAAEASAALLTAES